MVSHKCIKYLLPNYRLSNIFIVKIFISYIMSLKSNRIKTNNNIILHLDEEDSLGLTFNKCYEPMETKFILNTITNSMVVLDIGANIGYYTTIFSKLLKKGEVISFEPDSNNFLLLKKNCELNKMRNIKLHKLACGNVNKSKNLFISTKNKGDHRTYRIEDEKRESKVISMVRLDDFLSDIKKLDFVKIDVQGYEFDVILGMRNLISKFKPIIVLEFWPKGLLMNKHNPKKFLDFIYNLGYDIHLLTFSNDNCILNKIELDNHDSIYESERNDLNIVLKRKL